MVVLLKKFPIKGLDLNHQDEASDGYIIIQVGVGCIWVTSQKQLAPYFNEAKYCLNMITEKKIEKN